MDIQPSKLGFTGFMAAKGAAAHPHPKPAVVGVFDNT